MVAKVETAINSVKMQDGTVVDFAGKAKIKKSPLIGSDGSLALRVDFADGTVRIYSLNASLVNDYALHGASQKFGDEVAGLKDESGAPASVEDMVQAMDELDARVNGKGEWKSTREGGAISGGSILAKALVEVTKQTAEKVRDFLSALSPKEKSALRNEKGVREVVLRLTEEKLAKQKPSEEGASILDSLMGKTATRNA